MTIWFESHLNKYLLIIITELRRNAYYEFIKEKNHRFPNKYLLIKFYINMNFPQFINTFNSILVKWVFLTNNC